MPTTGSVTSADGTIIGYRQVGSGPGLVLVHGGMQAAVNLTDLAAALSDVFTVYVPDRRGRGRSGPFGDRYGIERECQDLAALLAQTGARYVFGLSSGALISLHAARTQPAIAKVILFEPPQSIDHSTPTAWAARYDREIAAGNLGAAMVAAINGTQTGPKLFTVIPRRVLGPLLTCAMKRPAADDDGVSLAALVPTMHYDVGLVMETDGDIERFQAIEIPVLLLGGSKSASYLKGTLAALESVLPDVRRVELSGADHLAPDNSGKPRRVAQEIRQFLTGATP
jgi:pimeloyl-ACP methyl ester carboxylesterase